MKSSKRNHLRMLLYYQKKDGRSKDQNKNEFYFISLALKTSVNKIFFLTKQSFISGLV